jgi:site-specific recombinase XerD
MRLLEALEVFSRQLVADGRSPHTQRQYTRHVRLFARWATRTGHSDDIDRIRHDDVLRFLADPAALVRPDGRRKLPQSVNVLRSSLKGFFGYARGAGLSTVDPTALLRRARCAGGPPRFLSTEDSSRLLAVMESAASGAEQRDRMLVRLLLATGLRLGSALGLDVQDIDFANGELNVRSCKGAREVCAVLGAEIRAQLAAFVTGRGDGPVFIGRDGDRMSPRQAQKRLARWFATAGVRGSAHALRHTFATRLYEATGDLLLVSTALHHRSVASTNVYARPTPRRVRAAIDQLAATRS